MCSYIILICYLKEMEKGMVCLNFDGMLVGEVIDENCQYVVELFCECFKKQVEQCKVVEVVVKVEELWVVKLSQLMEKFGCKDC